MINYSSNYSNIIELVKNYFSLDNKSLEEFKEKMSVGTTADDEIREKLDNNFRIEKTLSLNEAESFDDSWKMFKYYFGEYCIEKKITYSEFLMNSRVNQKNVSKISKDILNYYNNEDTVLKEIKLNNNAFYISDVLSEINNLRLPKKKLKFVISFNLSDMFMCSTGQEWTSCLNLDSRYFGCYWLGLASLPFDKNRCIMYLTSQNDKPNKVFGIEVEKMYKRTFGLLDNSNRINILKWYPSNFLTEKYLKEINEIIPYFNFKKIGNDFTPKHSTNLPSLKRDSQGKKKNVYVYQDKTFIQDNTLIFNNEKNHQYFDDGHSSFGSFINCDGGLRKLMDSQEEVIDYIKEERSCAGCEEYFPVSSMHEFDGRLYCESCFNEDTAVCDRCQRRVYSHEFDFEVDMCRECSEETENEEAI